MKQKSVKKEEFKRRKEEERLLRKERLAEKEELKRVKEDEKLVKKEELNRAKQEKKKLLKEEKEKLVKEEEGPRRGKPKKEKLVIDPKPEEHDVYDSDSSDDYYHICKETQEKLGPNYQKVADSEGFDADVIDDRRYNGIRAFPPCLLSLWMDDLLIYCNSAIETYNKENGTNLKVVEVVKAVYEPAGRYQDFHLTFTAKDSDSDKDAAAATYQARVYVICTDFPVEVKLCRLAPASYQI